MILAFSDVMFEWRGPSPFFFVRVPGEVAVRIGEVASMVTYGWGVIPATLTIGKTTVTTSLFPKDGGYLVPIKNAVRIPERLSTGDVVSIVLEIAV